MNLKFKNAFYVFKASMLILSVIIGAGLASGQEVVIYFAQYGFISIFFLIILFLAFFFGIKLFLNFGKNYSIDFIKTDKFFKIFDYLSLIIFTIIGAAMMACINNLLNETICEFSFPLWSLISILLSSIILIFEFKGLLNINTYLVPLMIFGILFICFKANNISPLSSPAISTDFLGFGLLFLSSISYACCNLVLSNKLIFTIGKTLNKKQRKAVSLIVSFILIFIIGIIIISILINDNIQLYIDLPLLSMAFLIDNSMGYFFTIIILISILTTLFSAQYSFHRIIGKRFCFFISIPSFFILSLFGFNQIILYLYPIISGLGFIMLIYVVNLSSKMRLNYTNNKIHYPS